jgi:hypothetical protein
MAKKVIKITTHVPALPDWLKISNAVTIPLPLKNAKELPQKLSEIDDDVEIKVNFNSGKKTALEIFYEPEKNR